jgi:hypothetical protein
MRINIVSVSTRRQKLLAYGQILDSHPRGIVDQLVPHFGEAVSEDPDSR